MIDKLDHLAARQHGLVVVHQLAAAGISPRQVAWAVSKDQLILMRYRVYRYPGVPVTWEQAVLAAVLSVGRGAMASHTTAAAIWGLRHCDRDRAGMHLTSPYRIQAKGVTGHRVVLGEGERTVFNCIPVSTVERTIIDLAGTLSITQLGQTVDDAIRRRMLRLERLRKLVAAAPGRGRLLEPVHKVLADRLPGYRPDDSDFETAMNRWWDEAGLPAADRQHRVRIDGRTYRLDRAIVAQKIAVEWDSDRYHTMSSDRDHDSNRRARLVGEGWVVIPVTGHSEPRLVVQAVLRAFRDRGGAGNLGSVA